MPTLRQFLVACDDDNGENRDMIVHAKNPAAAMARYRIYMKREGGFDPRTEAMADVRVFELPPVTGSASGVQPWAEPHVFPSLAE